MLTENEERQIIYWRVAYPWPMSHRDYVFLRKSKLIADPDRWCIIGKVGAVLIKFGRFEFSLFTKLGSRGGTTSSECSSLWCSQAVLLLCLFSLFTTDHVPLLSGKSDNSEHVDAVKSVIRVDQYEQTIAFQRNQSGNGTKGISIEL